jgi:uncharacterized LabA/DUF88 family protein
MDNKKERVVIIFDGSNFYHILKNKNVNIQGTLQYQYQRIAEWLANGRKIISIKYYVGIARFDKNNPEQSQRLVSGQQKLFVKLAEQNVELVRGYMMKNDGTYHEKGVDVKIAVDMMIGAYENRYDTVILISSDTDLIPAVEKVIKLKKKVEYIGLSYRPSFGLMKKVSETKLLTKNDLDKFQ